MLRFPKPPRRMVHSSACTATLPVDKVTSQYLEVVLEGPLSLLELRGGERKPRVLILPHLLELKSSTSKATLRNLD